MTAQNYELICKIKGTEEVVTLDADNKYKAADEAITRLLDMRVEDMTEPPTLREIYDGEPFDSETLEFHVEWNDYNSNGSCVIACGDSDAIDSITACVWNSDDMGVYSERDDLGNRCATADDIVDEWKEQISETPLGRLFIRAGWSDIKRSDIELEAELLVDRYDDDLKWFYIEDIGTEENYDRFEEVLTSDDSYDAIEEAAASYDALTEHDRRDRVRAEVCLAAVDDDGLIDYDSVMVTYDITKFSVRLRAKIEKKGLTQKAAAEVIGVPLRTFENWLGGVNTPTQITQEAALRKLALSK